MRSGVTDDLSAMAERMSSAVSHRGPDDSGVWVDRERGFALSHRRLAVVDLSEAGHQPMVSASGRYVIAYNGEVYNHHQLRAQIQSLDPGVVWRGRSDTETILKCVEMWGIGPAVEKFVGMFAFALWDRQERKLLLARDRAGEKPLYYGWQGNTFLFGSELKALKAHPSFGAAVDRGALALYLRRSYVPAPHSIFEGVHKLPPGTWLELSEVSREPSLIKYWSLGEVATSGQLHPFTGGVDEAVERLGALLAASVRMQCISEVPLGSLLSGGVDSSLVTALMQSQSSEPVKTFTIGFANKRFDEAANARAVAAHLGTDHTELQLTAADALSVIPRLSHTYDEPFADSSQLPTQIVMALARKSVTVALSGDGADELFGGYNRYMFLPRAWQLFGWMPRSVRAGVLRGGASFPGLVGLVTGAAQIDTKLAKLRKVFRGRSKGVDDLFLSTVTEWSNPSEIVSGYIDARDLLEQREKWHKVSDSVSRMMMLDGQTYLPDDILVKVDRAAMAVSLETRAPFLDRDVMEFAWRLPVEMKVRHGVGKMVLKKLLHRHIPQSLVERPKMGFGVPLDDWLRGPLRQWAGDLLDEDRIRRDGLLLPKQIVGAWNSHLRGDGNFSSQLWPLIMFQAWSGEWRGNA